MMMMMIMVNLRITYKSDLTEHEILHWKLGITLARATEVQLKKNRYLGIMFTITHWEFHAMWQVFLFLDFLVLI
jgi:hypothetical protein